MRSKEYILSKSNIGISVQNLNWKPIFGFQFRIWTETQVFSSDSELKWKKCGFSSDSELKSKNGFSVQILNWKVEYDIFQNLIQTEIVRAHLQQRWCCPGSQCHRIWCWWSCLLLVQRQPRYVYPLHFLLKGRSTFECHFCSSFPLQKQKRCYHFDTMAMAVTRSISPEKEWAKIGHCFVCAFATCNHLVLPWMFWSLLVHCLKHTVLIAWSTQCYSCLKHAVLIACSTQCYFLQESSLLSLASWWKLCVSSHSCFKAYNAGIPQALYRFEALLFQKNRIQTTLNIC